MTKLLLSLGVLSLVLSPFLAHPVEAKGHSYIPTQFDVSHWSPSYLRSHAIRLKPINKNANPTYMLWNGQRVYLDDNSHVMFSGISA